MAAAKRCLDKKIDSQSNKTYSSYAGIINPKIDTVSSLVKIIITLTFDGSRTLFTAMKSDEFNIPKPDSYMLKWAPVFSESDRGMVICGLALLDEVLREVIQSKMPDDEDSRSVQELVFDSSRGGSLSTLHSRRLLAHAMGWISSYVSHEIVQLARIRNHFAHSHTAVDFHDSNVHKYIRKLKTIELGRMEESLERLDDVGSDIFVLISHGSKISFHLENEPVAKLLFASTLTAVYDAIVAEGEL